MTLGDVGRRCGQLSQLKVHEPAEVIALGQEGEVAGAPPFGDAGVEEAERARVLAEAGPGGADVVEIQRVDRAGVESLALSLVALVPIDRVALAERRARDLAERVVDAGAVLRVRLILRQLEELVIGALGVGEAAGKLIADAELAQRLQDGVEIAGFARA